MSIPLCPPVAFRLPDLTATNIGFLSELPRCDILIQAEEIIRIKVRLDRDHTVPSFLISLWYALLLITAHKIYVNTGFYRWAKLLEELADRGNIAGIGRCV